jgi:hypothetical protein
MSMLLLALAVMAPAGPALGPRPGYDFACSVSVTALDERGREWSAQRVSAGRAPAVVFRGRLSRRLADTPPLLFDVFNPRGQRYQVLVAAPRPGTAVLRGLYQPRRTRVFEATLAVAGSSIAWTSMYGEWRVEPRLEGRDAPCGPPQLFTIRP